LSERKRDRYREREREREREGGRKRERLSLPLFGRSSLTRQTVKPNDSRVKHEREREKQKYVR
jgi:hypothetical protein